MTVTRQSDDETGIILEYLPVGNALEVAAIEENSGIEVRFMAPLHTPMEAVYRLAASKLEYVKKRRKQAPPLPKTPENSKSWII